jgi:hypothetical protein
MYVMTIDQRGSRGGEDLVEGLLRRLNSDAALPTLRRFERTAGDEVQGVLDDAGTVVRIALMLAATGHWSVGIGTGPVREPLPESTRAGAGPAFEHARSAVTEAKNSSGRICVHGVSPRCNDVDAVLQLLGALAIRRSAAAVEAGELQEQGLTQQQVAERLAISQQAVSSRLRSGLWFEDRRVRSTAVRLLQEANE